VLAGHRAGGAHPAGSRRAVVQDVGLEHVVLVPGRAGGPAGRRLDHGREHRGQLAHGVLELLDPPVVAAQLVADEQRSADRRGDDDDDARAGQVGQLLVDMGVAGELVPADEARQGRDGEGAQAQV
jgi:hypothetical protein